MRRDLIERRKISKYNSIAVQDYKSESHMSSIPSQSVNTYVSSQKNITNQIIEAPSLKDQIPTLEIG